MTFNFNLFYLKYNVNEIKMIKGRNLEEHKSIYCWQDVNGYYF